MNVADIDFIRGFPIPVDRDTSRAAGNLLLILAKLAGASASAILTERMMVSGFRRTGG
jgi:hypothetical protein